MTSFSAPNSNETHHDSLSWRTPDACPAATLVSLLFGTYRRKSHKVAPEVPRLTQRCSSHTAVNVARFFSLQRVRVTKKQLPSSPIILFWATRSPEQDDKRWSFTSEKQATMLLYLQRGKMPHCEMTAKGCWFASVVSLPGWDQRRPRWMCTVMLLWVIWPAWWRRRHGGQTYMDVSVCQLSISFFFVCVKLLFIFRQCFEFLLDIFQINY